MTEILNILIIDDNPDDRENYLRSLKKMDRAGYNCVEAEHGSEGIEIIYAQPIDCVLLDYSLPGMNGLDVLKKLRETHEFLPTILLTGQGNEVVAVEAIKHGAYDYLTKSSVTPERLHHAIKLAIAQDRIRKELGESTKQLSVSRERYDLVVKGYERWGMGLECTNQ